MRNPQLLRPKIIMIHALHSCVQMLITNAPTYTNTYPLKRINVYAHSQRTMRSLVGHRRPFTHPTRTVQRFVPGCLARFSTQPPTDHRGCQAASARSMRRRLLTLLFRHQQFTTAKKIGYMTEWLHAVFYCQRARARAPGRELAAWWSAPCVCSRVPWGPPHRSSQLACAYASRAQDKNNDVYMDIQ